MSDLLWFIRRPPVAITLVLFLFSLVVFLMRDYKAAEIISNMEITSDGKHTIVVEAGIELEAFHMERLQSHGTMLKVDGRTVRLRAVSYENLNWLARQPWIDAIEIWDGV